MSNPPSEQEERIPHSSIIVSHAGIDFKPVAGRPFLIFWQSFDSPFKLMALLHRLSEETWFDRHVLRDVLEANADHFDVDVR